MGDWHFRTKSTQDCRRSHRVSESRSTGIEGPHHRGISPGWLPEHARERFEPGPSHVRGGGSQTVSSAVLTTLIGLPSRYRCSSRGTPTRQRTLPSVHRSPQYARRVILADPQTRRVPPLLVPHRYCTQASSNTVLWLCIANSRKALMSGAPKPVKTTPLRVPS